MKDKNHVNCKLLWSFYELRSSFYPFSGSEAVELWTGVRC